MDLNHDVNTTQVKGNCVLHVRQDSDTDLEHLFNSVLNKDAPQSIPLRMRNLPPSFFQPYPGGGGGIAQVATPSHIRTRSLPANIGQIASEPNSLQQPPPNFNPLHQRKHSHDALDPNGAYPPGWEPRTTALGQKYFVK